jgi:hypothetical protein
MKLRDMKRSIKALSFQQLVKLDAWLHSVIETAERAGSHPTKHIADHKSYRSEMVRCGKERCKCAKGELHGPYWYAYWSEDGKTRSQYIGKRLPKGIKTSYDVKASGV